MRTQTRIAVMVVLGLVMSFGVSTLVSGGGRGVPAPPPPVLCGCACPDGSFVITHAPDENSCPAVCETACPQDM